MAPTEPPTEVTIRVKVPPGHIPGANDEVFAIGTLSTSLPISVLRQRIHTLVPGNSPATSQRILYGGRALVDNEQTIADALNTRRDPAQTEYVVHLLIRNGAGNTERAEGGHMGAGMHIPSMNATAATQAHQDALQGLRASLESDRLPRGFMNPGNAGSLPQTGVFPRPAVVQEQRDGLPTVGNPGIASLAQGEQANVPITSTIPTPNSGVPNSQTSQHSAHRHLHHHHHHHPQPHFHHGPHMHGQGQQSPFPRPVSGSGFHISGTGPQGQQFEIHQETFSVPNNHSPIPTMHANHLAGMPLPVPGFAMGMPFPGMQQQPQGTQPIPTALDRARENMTEMRRMVDTLRNDNASEEARAQLADLERRMQAVNDYIDPFRLSTRPQPGPTAVPAAGVQLPPGQPTPIVPTWMNSPMRIPIGNVPLQMPQLPMPFRLPGMPPMHDATHSPSPGIQQQTDTTSVYLLSSPQGPHALLFSPQHGTFTGAVHGSSPYSLQQMSAMPLTPGGNAAIPTLTQPGQANGGQPAQNGQQEQPGMGQVVHAQANPVELVQALLQPFLGPLWLLCRIMIFSYFLMGADMGWRRPVALALIGLGFWLIRLGLFGEGGLVRRWWDGVVRVEDVRERLRRLGLIDAPVAQAQNVAQATGTQAPVNANAQAPARPFPTPEDLAQRLLREQRQNTPLQRLREQVRPAERALALFIASLWPGVGERYVQALDRAREEEETARRVIQSQREEAEQQAQAAETDKPSDVADVPKEGNDESVVSTDQTKDEAGPSSIKTD